MKKVVLIILVFISLQSRSQTYDSLFFELRQRKINFTDKSGRKQGEWTYYKIPLCQNDSSVLNQESNQIFVSTTSKGEYINNQKIGVWEYYSDNYNPYYKGCQQITRDIIKEVHYNHDSITIIGFQFCNTCIEYIITSNQDSTSFKAKIFDYKDMIIGTCYKEKSSDTTICRLLGGKQRDFIRKEYRFIDIDIDIDKAFDFVECGWLCW